MKENYLKIGAGTLLHLHFEINVLLPSHFLYLYIMEKRVMTEYKSATENLLQ